MFEVLDDGNENITIKVPEEDDDNSFTIIQTKKPIIEKPVVKNAEKVVN